MHRNTFLKTSYVIYILDEIANAFAMNEEAFNSLELANVNGMVSSIPNELFEYQFDEMSDIEKLALFRITEQLIFELIKTYQFDSRFGQTSNLGLVIDKLRVDDEYQLELFD